MIVGVQEANSPYSIEKISLSITPSAEMSLEVIGRKRFKDGGFEIDQLSKIIQECIINLKNISIYSPFGRNCLMKRFILDQRL